MRIVFFGVKQTKNVHEFVLLKNRITNRATAFWERGRTYIKESNIIGLTFSFMLEFIVT